MPFPTKSFPRRARATALLCAGLSALTGCSSPSSPSPKPAPEVSANATNAPGSAPAAWGSAAPAISPPGDASAPADPAALDEAKTEALGGPVLASLLRAATHESPRMDEQELNIVRNDAFRFRGWRQHLPFVSAGYGIGYFKLVRGDNRGNDENLGGTYSVSLRYPIFAWGAIAAEKAAARLRESSAMLNAQINWNYLCEQIRGDYFRAVLLKNDIALKKRRLELENRRYARTTASKDAGDLSPNNHIARSVTLRRLTADLQNAAATLADLTATLRTTSGLTTFTEADIPETVKVPAVDPAALAALLETFAPETNSATLAARYAREQSELMDAEITQARSRMLPNLGLGASIAQNPVQTNTNRFEMQTVLFAGINGTWNIFDREATQTSVRALQTQKRAIERQLRSQNTYRALGLGSLLQQIRALLQGLEIRKTYLENARTTLAEMRQRLQLGSVSQMDVEDAEMNVTDLERGILGDQIELTRAYYRFLAGIEQDPAATLYTPPRNE